MARYIDLDELLYCIKGVKTVYNIIRDIANEQPTADVAPVKRGEWEDVKSGYDMRTHFRRCSNCKTIREKRFSSSYLYCPSCGAKMEGDTE